MGPHSGGGACTPGQSGGPPFGWQMQPVPIFSFNQGLSTQSASSVGSMSGWSTPPGWVQVGQLIYAGTPSGAVAAGWPLQNVPQSGSTPPWMASLVTNPETGASWNMVDGSGSFTASLNSPAWSVVTTPAAQAPNVLPIWGQRRSG